MQIIDKTDIKIANFLDHVFLVWKTIPAERQRNPIMQAPRQIKVKFANRKSIADVGFEFDDGNIMKLIKSPPRLEKSNIAPETIKIVLIDLILLFIFENLKVVTYFT